jgi:hypothetical protein
MLEDLGELDITCADDANIPVNCFLGNEDEEHPNQWVWTADNFMPRKSHVSSGAYRLVADTKEEILELIQKHVVPLYEIALAKIKTGELYYWDK